MKKYIFTTLICMAGILNIDAYCQQTDNLNAVKWIRPVVEQNLRPYSEGFAAFYDIGLWGFEDINGDIVIIPKYEEVGDFQDGLARVKKEGKWGVVNKKGDLLFPCVYDSMEPFSDGVSLAKQGAIYFYLYQDGKTRKLPSEYSFYSYHSGFARIMQNTKKGKKWGFVDKKGYFAIDPEYDSASDFFGDYAFVSKKGEQFIINKRGKKQAVNHSFDPSRTVLSSDNGSGFVKNNDGLFSFVKEDKGSFSILRYALDRAEPFSENLALIENKNQIRFLNPDGSTAFSLEKFDNAGSFSEGKAWVSSNEKFGYIDKKGKLIIDTVFSYASDFKNGYAFVVYNNRKGIIRLARHNDISPDLVIADFKLTDMNDNGKVETDEKFKLDVTVKNDGNETAKNIDVFLSGKAGQSEWFQYETTTQNIGQIEPGQSETVSFIGIANTDLVSEDILMNVKVLGDNTFLATNSSMTFPAMGINQCKPLIATYWAHNADHTPIISGKESLIEITVKNDGSDIAKNVQLNLKWPEGIHTKSNNINMGNILPGESKTAKANFTITNSTDAKQFSVVATLTDFTKKHTEVQYLAFETDKLNFAVNLIGGGYRQPPAQLASLYATNNMPAGNAPETAAALPENTKSELSMGITMIRQPDVNKFALIIGNEDYNSFKQQTLYEPNVDFAVRDAETFADYAKNFFGVPESQIILLKNATYSQMNFNINKITNIAKANAGNVELFIYYAGHGQVDGASKESFLIPVDVSTTAPTAGIKLEEMYAKLGNSKAKRTYVFLDACYSGVGRGIVITPKKTTVTGNIMIMTASSSTQRSMPYAEKKHGMFTYFLLKQLRDTQGDITVNQLYNAVKKNVRTNSIWINNMEQTPEIICGPDIENGWENWKL